MTNAQISTNKVAAIPQTNSGMYILKLSFLYLLISFCFGIIFLSSNERKNHMLTKMERKILKCCNKKCNPTDIISTCDIQKNLKDLSINEIATCCNHLNENGYFDLYSISLANDVKLHLNYKGMHYQELNINRIKSFIFQSVIVPIFVSLVTSVILQIFLN